MSLYQIPNYDNEPIADDKHERFMAVLKMHSAHETNPIQEWHLETLTEVKDSQCICSQPILNQYFISNDTTRTTLIIGSDCMKRFLDCTLKCSQCSASIKNVATRIKENEYLCKQCKATKKKEALALAERQQKLALEQQRKEAEIQKKIKRMGTFCLFWFGRYYQKPFKIVVEDEAYVEYLLNLPDEKTKCQTLRTFLEYASHFYEIKEVEFP